MCCPLSYKDPCSRQRIREDKKLKFKIPRPPAEGENTKKQLESLVSWLCILAESLNVTLSNLSEENFSEGARKKLFDKKEEDNDKV